MRYVFLAVLMSLLPLSYAQADVPLSEMPAGQYTLDKTHASINWKVSHMGFSNYTARFTDFDATIDLVPDDLASSTVSVAIDPMSIETDYPNAEEKDFNKKLSEGEDWLNAAVYPEITWVSTGIEMTGDNTAMITGDLTMLGVTKPLTLDVTFNKAVETHPYFGGPVMGFSARGTLDRTEWGFDTHAPNIGANVDLLIEVEFMGAKPEEVDDVSEESSDAE